MAEQQKEETWTTGERVHWYFRQYAGLALTLLAIAMLCFGYGKEIGGISNTVWIWMCMLVILVGLAFHEFRPYNLVAMAQEKREKEALGKTE